MKSCIVTDSYFGKNQMIAFYLRKVIKTVVIFKINYGYQLQVVARQALGMLTEPQIHFLLENLMLHFSQHFWSSLKVCILHKPQYSRFVYRTFTPCCDCCRVAFWRIKMTCDPLFFFYLSVSCDTDTFTAHFLKYIHQNDNRIIMTNRILSTIGLKAYNIG